MSGRALQTQARGAQPGVGRKGLRTSETPAVVGRVQENDVAPDSPDDGCSERQGNIDPVLRVDGN